MPFAILELQRAYQAYRKFLSCNPPPYHARYIFPFFAGTYFSYREVDVMRIVAIAKSVAPATISLSYVDIGCGYGDFLARIRDHLPRAMGIEKEGGIFSAFQVARPNYIQVMSVESFSPPIDVAFVGWMEPGQDFRKYIAEKSNCVITTFDAGGQCGINGGCEYDEFGFERVAWWRTPSWIDVNTELMNNYYTPSLDAKKKEHLRRLRTAHNFWYVYTRPEITNRVRSCLKSWLSKEDPHHGYDFEFVLDECGFGYNEELPALMNNKRLWEVMFD
jgi:hypothetical protein